MTSTDISQTVADMRRYFNTGETRPVSFRVEQLRKLKSMIRSHEDEIIHARYNDLKKPPFESYASEIGIMYVEIEHAIRHVKSWSRPRRVATPIIHFLSSSRIYQEPYGVALIMGPWNYPFQLLIAPLVGAMAAGNCVVIKPSELAGDMSETLSKLISNYFQLDYICAVEGGVEVSQQLLAEKFDYIFYTGGTAVGRVVMEAASRNLTPVTLELGGKSPCIVDKDAAWIMRLRGSHGGSSLRPGRPVLHRTTASFIAQSKRSSWKRLKKRYGIFTVKIRCKVWITRE
jgi:acyl-CoA reductase-like NAD-dependent aldehyde dehydrogenase